MTCTCCPRIDDDSEYQNTAPCLDWPHGAAGRNAITLTAQMMALKALQGRLQIDGNPRGAISGPGGLDNPFLLWDEEGTVTLDWQPRSFAFRRGRHEVGENRATPRTVRCGRGRAFRPRRDRNAKPAQGRLGPRNCMRRRCDEGMGVPGIEGVRIDLN